MIKKYKKAIKKKIEKYCDLHYEKIGTKHMKMGKGLYNQRCQMNAVQQVKEGKMVEVYSVICFNDSNYPFVHFINKDKDGFFVDNTLGWQYEIYNYYIINKIDDSQYVKINDILMDIKEELINLHSHKLLNKLFFIDKYNLGI